MLSLNLRSDIMKLKTHKPELFLMKIKDLENKIPRFFDPFIIL